MASSSRMLLHVVEELQEHDPGEHRQAVEVAIQALVLAHDVAGGLDHASEPLCGSLLPGRSLSARGSRHSGAPIKYPVVRPFSLNQFLTALLLSDRIRSISSPDGELHIFHVTSRSTTFFTLSRSSSESSR